MDAFQICKYIFRFKRKFYVTIGSANYKFLGDENIWKTLKNENKCEQNYRRVEFATELRIFKI